MPEKKNVYWINAVKAIAIIAVFLSHVQAIYGYSIGLVHRFISPWYVNAFFFVSGYLLFRKQLSEPIVEQSEQQYFSRTGGGQILLINVLMRIVLPSILFAAIEFFPSSLMQGRGIDMVNFAYKTIGGGTYWFTSALAVSEIIELFLLTTRIKNIWFYFLTSLVIGLMGMSYQNGMYRQEFWAWHRGIIAVMFLGFGGLYWRYENVISKYFRRCYITTGLMVLYTAILLCCKNTNPNISILSLQPLGIVTTLFACVLLIELCKVLPENRIVNYIGQNTLGFYFMSGALPIVVSMLAHKLISGSYLVVMLADWIICLILAYAFVKLINRWLPWMFDFKKMNLKNKQL